MKIRVQYTAQLRAALGRGEEEVELPEGSSLAVLLRHLADHYNHEAAPHLVAPTGDLLTSLLVIVNDSAKGAGDAATMVLKAGDVVTLLPPIAGG